MMICPLQIVTFRKYVLFVLSGVPLGIGFSLIFMIVDKRLKAVRYFHTRVRVEFYPVDSFQFSLFLDTSLSPSRA